MTTQAPTPEQIQAAWDAIAPGFDRYVTPANLRLGERLLDRLELRPGTRFLDVAAGSGALAIAAARRGAEVTAVDLAPVMVERLVDRARAEGLARVTGTVMDGQALEFADGSFDAAGSLHGVSLFPDVGRGVAELVRVTRPGGQVLLAGFGAMQRAEFIGFLMSAMQAAVPGFTPLPTDPPPLPFQLAQPEKMRDVLTGAGLTDVAVGTVDGQLPVESADHLWNVFTASNPIAARLVADLTPQQCDQVRQVLDGMLRERSGGGPAATLHVELTVGTGRVGRGAA